MEKKITCGILVCSKHGFLALLPSGRKDDFGSYDIPKGCHEEYDKELYDTAIRELKEETGIDLPNILKYASDPKVTSFGVNPYLKEKDLALFVAEISDIDKFFNFECTSFFETPNGLELPEVVSYKWVRDLNYYFRSMQKCFKRLRETNSEFNNILEKYEKND